MTVPGDRSPRAWALLAIPDTGRHGTARLDALTAIARALGCQASSREPLTGHRQRGAHGDYYLTVYGPQPIVAWFSRSQPRIIAALDQAATAATRRYAAWLRDGCPPEDHMPAERPGLRARWRRDYLRTYAATLAARIRGWPLPPAQPADAERIYRAHHAQPAAERDAAAASLTPFTPPPALTRTTSPLRVAVTAAEPPRRQRALPSQPPPAPASLRGRATAARRPS
jgi:hypothetical protein